MTFPKTALKTIGGGKGGGPSYPSLQRSRLYRKYSNISIFPGNPNNHFFKDGNGETTICYAKIGLAIQLKQPFINGCSRFQVYIEVFRDMWVWQQKNTETFWGYLRIMLRIPHEVPGCCNTFAPRLVACSSLATSESAIPLELRNKPSYFPLYWLFSILAILIMVHYVTVPP